MGKSITRHLALIAVLGMVPAGAALSWREAPEYTALFAPANHRDLDRFAVTQAGLEEVLADLGADPSLARTPEAWVPRPESPIDAFGMAGQYNRWQISRVYGSRQPRVVRGSRMERGRVVEAWTLISPYPSVDLRTLHAGTMRLILTVAP